MGLNEKMENIRESALDLVEFKTEKVKVGTATYAIKTEFGWAKVAITAVRDPEYDGVADGAEYLAELELKLEAKKQRERMREIKAARRK